jgi:hypothetical protein
MQEIAGVGREVFVAVDMARWPFDLDLIELSGLSDPKVDSRV